MLKKIREKSFINISFVGIGTVASAVLGFIYLTSVAKYLPIDQFGKYALLASFLVTLSKLLDFGTNSLYVTKAIATGDKKLTNYFVSIKIILFIIALPLSLLVLYFFNMASLANIVIFSLGLLFYGFNYTLFGLFQKLEKFTLLILLNFIPAVIKGVFAILVFTGAYEFTQNQLFMVFSFSIGFSSLLYFLLPKELQKLHLDFSNIKETLKNALSPGISQLINESFSAISNSLAKIFANFTSVGIFSLADKISNVFVLVSFTIFTVLLPKNALRKREKQGYDYLETILLSLGVLLLAVVTIVIAKFFIPWFFENKFNESLQLLNILVFAGAITAIHTFMENYFFVENKTKYLAYISAGKLAMVVLFSLALIPLYSLQGLAWAHFISAFITLGIVGSIVFSHERSS